METLLSGPLFGTYSNLLSILTLNSLMLINSAICDPSLTALPTMPSLHGLTLSTANYQQAVEVLCKRFGNKQVIISNHMDTPMNTPMNMDAVSSDRHIKDLRRLYDKTESHVHSLKSQTEDSPSPALSIPPQR